MLLLAIILASMPSVFINAFRSSATATPPDVAPLDLPTKRTNLLPRTQPDETNQSSAAITIKYEKQETAPPKKFKYDLGLGKNKPVTNTRADETPRTNDKSLNPARFMIEHEAVSKYPSPLDSNSNSSHRTKSSRKNLPKVQHRRHSEDVLHIRDSPSVRNGHENDNNDDNSRHPVIFPVHRLPTESSASMTKLDVNTVWVEMMLHNEQNKILA